MSRCDVVSLGPAKTSTALTVIIVFVSSQGAQDTASRFSAST